MVRPWGLPELGRVARRLVKVRSGNFSDEIRACRKMNINVTHKHYYKLEAPKVHSVGVVALMLEVSGFSHWSTWSCPKSLGQVVIGRSNKQADSRKYIFVVICMKWEIKDNSIEHS